MPKRHKRHGHHASRKNRVIAPVEPPKSMYGEYLELVKQAKAAGKTVKMELYTSDELEFMADYEYKTGLYKNRAEVREYITEKVFRDTFNTYGKEGDIQVYSPKQAQRIKQHLDEVSPGNGITVNDIMVGKFDVKNYVEEARGILGAQYSFYI